MRASGLLLDIDEKWGIACPQLERSISRPPNTLHHFLVRFLPFVFFPGGVAITFNKWRIPYPGANFACAAAVASSIPQSEKDPDAIYKAWLRTVYRDYLRATLGILQSPDGSPALQVGLGCGYGYG